MLLLLIALAVELLQLIGEIIDCLLVTFLQTCLRCLVLDADQLQVLLQFLYLVLTTPANLTLRHKYMYVVSRLLHDALKIGYSVQFCSTAKESQDENNWLSCTNTGLKN